MKKLLTIILLLITSIGYSQKYLIYSTIDSTQAKINQINAACIADNLWKDGITNNYCNVLPDTNNVKGAVLYDSKYNKYFTLKEIGRLEDLPALFTKKEKPLFLK